MLLVYSCKCLLENSVNIIYLINQFFLYFLRYGEAENDCNFSLKLDQTYVKALQRRAAARIEMQKYEYAEEDLLKVLQYEPKNIESKSQLEKLRSKMNKKLEEVQHSYLHFFSFVLIYLL